jgi:hypothetical protein
VRKTEGRGEGRAEAKHRLRVVETGLIEVGKLV